MWTSQNRNAKKLVIECFPAEAIWAAKRQNGYAAIATAKCTKAYKKQKGSRLTGDQVEKLTRDALHAFAFLSGDAPHWNSLLDTTTKWMLDDQEWQIDGRYRGGKLLDNVVDTMICLATAISYVRGCAHVWQDPDEVDDGHIIGPGCPKGDLWMAANNVEKQQ